MPLPAALAHRAALHGARPLLRCGDTVWTVAQAADIAARSAGRLQGAGIQPGDRVVLMAGNQPAFLEVVLGVWWLGAVIVPLHAASRGPQLRHMLDNAAPSLLVAQPDLLALLTDMAPGVPAWSIDALPAPGPAVPPASLRPGDTAAILYTSGTTGPSKGVCCPHAQLLWWGRNTAALLGLTQDDVLATTLPLFHVNALNTFLQALLTGAELVLLRRFSASRFWAAMQDSGATVAYVLGAMVPILLAQPPGPAESGHRLRIGLGPGVPADMQAALHARTGLRLIDGYGSTETNFVIGTMLDRQRPGLMGPVAAGFAAQVVDADDQPVPDGTAGELVLRADHPFAFATGYWRMPEQTVAAWRNLWFHTGDRVVRDADGWFRFLDRIKDSIRRRGENISAWEVEQVLLSHPAIAAGAVYPVRSDLAEDEVAAALVLMAGQTLAPAALLDWCRDQIAAHARPRYIRFLDALPLTENGKPRKHVLIEQGVTADTWDREAPGSR